MTGTRWQRLKSERPTGTSQFFYFKFKRRIQRVKVDVKFNDEPSVILIFLNDLWAKLVDQRARLITT